MTYLFSYTKRHPLLFVVAAFFLFVPLWGCTSEPVSFDDAAQRGVVQHFAKANFRGEEEVVYGLIANQDQEVVQAPLKRMLEGSEVGRGNVHVLKELKPSSLLKIVEVTNPYDIKSIDPRRSFSSPPAEGTRTFVEVQRYNGRTQTYQLVWEENQWKIALGLNQ